MHTRATLERVIGWLGCRLAVSAGCLRGAVRRSAEKAVCPRACGCNCWMLLLLLACLPGSKRCNNSPPSRLSPRGAPTARFRPLRRPDAPRSFSSDVGKSTELLADLLSGSKLSPDAVERERDVILREMEEVEGQVRLARRGGESRVEGGHRQRARVPRRARA